MQITEPGSYDLEVYVTRMAGEGLPCASLWKVQAQIRKKDCRIVLADVEAVEKEDYTVTPIQKNFTGALEKDVRGIGLPDLCRPESEDDEGQKDCNCLWQPEDLRHHPETGQQKNILCKDQGV